MYMHSQQKKEHHIPFNKQKKSFLSTYIMKICLADCVHIESIPKSATFNTNNWITN